MKEFRGQFHLKGYQYQTNMNRELYLHNSSRLPPSEQLKDHVTQPRLEVSAASHVSQPAAAEKNQFYGGTCPWVGLEQQPSYIPHLQAFDLRLFLAYILPSFLRSVCVFLAEGNVVSHTESCLSLAHCSL